jgi:hypothetical protein
MHLTLTHTMLCRAYEVANQLAVKVDAGGSWLKTQDAYFRVCKITKYLERRLTR